MQQYLDIVDAVLREGNHKPNRTEVDTISSFHLQTVYDLQEGFPLLTTKSMDGKRWESLVYEFLWYLSGDVHVHELQKHTSAWNPWTDDEGYLDSAVGRFWRRYPIPSNGEGNETWPDENNPWVTEDGYFDQLRYALDQLSENPYSRRIVLNAWHPANAATSRLPPCDYTFVCNVQDKKLNIHLTQRSADLGLGVPFDIARYALLAKVFAVRSGLQPGKLAHTLVDAHVYCGSGQQGQFYRDNLPELQKRLNQIDDRKEYLEIKKWIKGNAPEGTDPGRDHVPGLLTQLSRKPKPRPRVTVSDKDIDELGFEDFELLHYSSHPSIQFEIAT